MHLGQHGLFARGIWSPLPQTSVPLTGRGDYPHTLEFMQRQQRPVAGSDDAGRVGNGAFQDAIVRVVFHDVKPLPPGNTNAEG